MLAAELVRERLDALIRDAGENYASISRLLGRNPTYIQQFIRRGSPRRLAESDRRRLAVHFGVCEADLGGPPSRVVFIPMIDLVDLPAIAQRLRA